ncbi:uncharacterized protein LOC116207521 [Punica granatum]|uniref:Uncharacterized protein n=2 Tax=Punica granatum TaxID=22663 RepID=A0A218VXD7_PUNGR|nr:uncharacterized protein LOC116207521 [Punica granatum]XP_031396355.1 uncharacterized protein LOC116207521 [Punica granatum]OWM64532.1 hypothetical protein CDL15_Pgr020499 [Punica granatum]PKI32971.1 hypothetical protein CRG98_046645 [Punica granatum]
MQQSRYNDIRLLQQHLMLKQLQELQRQQQIPQLCDVRQQNSMNYPFAATKQATGDVSPLPLMNGTFPTDTSQLLTNWDHRGASPFVQGLPNHLSPSVEQGQALHLTGLLPQRVSASIYGGTRDKESHPSHLRGISPETANLANKINDHQQPISLLQSSALSSSFSGDQLAVSSEQVCVSEGSYMSKTDYLGQNMFGELPQTHSSGLLPGTFQPDNAMQTSTPVQEFSWKQDQAGWPGNVLQKPPEMVPLDPLEKKILYNSDDNAWDASFAKYSDFVPGGSGNSFEPMDTFPSLHSGSWSALMQSAVAETSSGDTGLTEEWSGLTYQNPENSTDNQASVIDSGKLHTGWVDNSLQSPFSLTSSPIPVINNSGMSPSIPVFQPSSVQSLNNQHDGLHQDVSHGADQKPVTNAIEWLDRYSMQKPPLQGNQQFQPPSHLNSWSTQNYDYPEGDKKPQSVTSYHDAAQSFSQGGQNNEVIYKTPNASGALANANSVCTVDGWRLAGGQDQLQSAASIFSSNKEDSKPNNFMGIQKLSTERSQQEASQHLHAYSQPNASSQVGIPMHDMGNTSTERNSDQNISASVLHHPLKAVNEAYTEDKDKFSGVEHGHLNASDIATNLAKESANSGGNLKESEGVGCGIELQPNKSISFDGSTVARGVNITALRSVAEKEWAEATNRLIEKLDGEVEKIKERWPQQRAKRRLLLSTQLMQQLLRASPASTLSVDVASTYDSLTYFVAQVTIGDACSLTNYHNSDSCMPSTATDRIQGKVEVSERCADNYFPKTIEDFMTRAKKLEDVLTRLEKTAPFSDINVESQELERYSVINRFAKFHIRGQPNSSKTLPPGSGAAPAVPKASPQRYVVAHPLPEKLPEGVKCLSL